MQIGDLNGILYHRLLLALAEWAILAHNASIAITQKREHTEMSTPAQETKLSIVFALRVMAVKVRWAILAYGCKYPISMVGSNALIATQNLCTRNLKEKSNKLPHLQIQRKTLSLQPLARLWSHSCGKSFVSIEPDCPHFSNKSGMAFNS